MSPNFEGFEELINQARAGNQASLGQLLELYRSYVGLLARLQIKQTIQGKVSASDLVQETFLRAKRGFSEFRGRSEGEIIAWLRSILAAQVSNVIRRYATQQRNVRSEQQLESELDTSSQAICKRLCANVESPSASLIRRERTVLLANALDQLNPKQRDVIILRHIEGLSFTDVAQRTGRTLDSIKSLWTRAIHNLRKHLHDEV